MFDFKIPTNATMGQAINDIRQRIKNEAAAAGYTEAQITLALCLTTLVTYLLFHTKAPEVAIQAAGEIGAAGVEAGATFAGSIIPV